MKLGIAVAALIAALAAYAVLESEGPNPQLDRVERAFERMACGGPAGDGARRKSLDRKRSRDWGYARPGLRFGRYIERTEPEATVNACKHSGPALRYFEFANRDEVRGAQKAYRADRRVCVFNSALFDLVSPDRELLRHNCDELGGQVM